MSTKCNDNSMEGATIIAMRSSKPTSSLLSIQGIRKSNPPISLVDNKNKVVVENKDCLQKYIAQDETKNYSMYRGVDSDMILESISHRDETKERSNICHEMKPIFIRSSTPIKNIAELSQGWFNYIM